MAELPSFAVYNPDLLDRDALVSLFVARLPLLERLIDDLRRDDGTGASQHQLLIGSRGMGKTTLLRRIAYAVQDEAGLSGRWLPLVFPEEQYNIARLSDLWVNCLDALGDVLEDRDRDADAERLDAQIAGLPSDDEGRRAGEALALLERWAHALSRRFVLLIDNIDLVLERLKKSDWAIREVLSSARHLKVIGASAVVLESTFQYDAAFYDFFRIHELRGLDEIEARAVMENLARIRNTPAVIEKLTHDPGRFRTLHTLTGGNPRTLVLLYNVLALDSETDVYRNLEQLLDLCTPLYKARFEALPAQAQQVVDALALRWDPALAADLAGDTRLEVNAVSSQLNRLAQQGIVEKAEIPPGVRNGFQISERFFNIWYLMRASRRVRRRLVWLVEFLKLFYGGSEFQARAKRFVHREASADDLLCQREAEVAFAYANGVDDKQLKAALEVRALELLLTQNKERQELDKLFDFQGDDASLKPIADRIAAWKQLRSQVFSTRIRWPKGVTAKDFWDLLSGDEFRSFNEKARRASELPARGAAEIRKFVDDLKSTKERADRSKTMAKERLALRLALQKGIMREAWDVEAAQAASDRLGTRLVMLALIWLGLRKEISYEERFKLLQTVAYAFVGPGEWACAARALSSGGEEILIRRFLESYSPRPRDPEFWGQAVHFLEGSEHATAAEAVLRAGLKFLPEDAGLWNNLSVVLGRDQQRFAEAEAAAKTALKLDESLVFARTNLGNTLMMQGRFEEAFEIFKNVNSLEPERAGNWRNQAECLRRMGRFQDAESAVRKAIALGDDLATVPLGHILVESGKLEEAAAEFQRIADSDSETSFDALLELGSVRQRQERLDEAESAFARAKKLRPTASEPFLQIGLLHERRRRWADALSSFQRAVEVNATDDHSWRHLAIALEREGNEPAAADAYRRLLALSPDDPQALNELAWNLRQQEPVEAEKLARRAVEVEKDNRASQHTLADILLRRRNWIEAAPIIKQFLGDESFISDAENWSHFVELFRLANSAGRAQESLELLRNAGLDERWRPLYAAIAAHAEGGRTALRRLAPEVRKPAEVLFDQIGLSTDSAEKAISQRQHSRNNRALAGGRKRRGTPSDPR